MFKYDDWWTMCRVWKSFSLTTVKILSTDIPDLSCLWFVCHFWINYFFLSLLCCERCNREKFLMSCWFSPNSTSLVANGQHKDGNLIVHEKLLIEFITIQFSKCVFYRSCLGLAFGGKFCCYDSKVLFKSFVTKNVVWWFCFLKN